MKRLILFWLLLMSWQLQAQTACDNEVSTDPNDPHNDALPVGTTAQRYLNKFDWFPVDPLSGEYMDYPCSNISFAGVQYPEMTNILLHTLDDYDYLQEGPLPISENGWELLMVNVGRYPDDQTELANGNFLNTVPYIVIYNKYNGIIRVFTNYGLDKDVSTYADAMEITLEFVAPEIESNGLMRLSNSYDQALDQNTEVTKLSSVVKAPAQMNLWASTDFVVSYDPCTCYYPSNLRLKFKEIKSSDIELIGRAVTLEDEPLVDNTDLTVPPTEFLSNVNYNNDDIRAGLVLEKSMSVMIDNYYVKYKAYNKKLVANGEHNKRVKRNLALLKAAKYIIGFTIAPPAILVPVGTSEEQKQVIMAQQAEIKAAEESGAMSSQERSEAFEGLEGYGSSISWFKVIENIKEAYTKINEAGDKIFNPEKIFEKVTEIFGEKVNTFIAKNFKEEAPPAAPPVPTASFTEMYFKGSISQSVEQGGFTFYTPGTYGSEGTGSPTIITPSEYPVYNEVLGTFALLKTPKLKISMGDWLPAINQVSQKTNTYISGFYGVNMQRYQSWVKNYQIKLDEDLQFALNSVLDIKDYKVTASYHIMALTKEVDSIPHGAVINAYNEPQNAVNVGANINLDAYTPIRSHGLQYKTNYYTPNYDLYFYPDTPVEPTIQVDTIIFDTPHIPIDAFRPFVASMGLVNESMTFHEHLIPAQYINDYPHTYEDGVFTWDLSNPNIPKPELIYDLGSGYEYEFIIELKLIVDIEFDQLDQYGNTNKVTQLFTYQIPAENISLDYFGAVPNIPNTSLNVDQYKKDMNIGTTDFHGQQVDGCSLSGSAYTCQAIQDVFIEGDLTTSNGYSVTILGGNEVSVVGNSTVSPEIVLDIHPVLDYSHPMPKASLQEVVSFCKGNNNNPPEYQANIASKSAFPGSQTEGDPNGSPASSELNWDFTLYPNPANGSTTIRLLNDWRSEGHVEVYDLTGKSMAIKQAETSAGMLQIEASSFAKGVYFVKVRMPDGSSRVKQLVIQ